MKKIASIILAAMAGAALCVSVCAFVPQNIKSIRPDLASRIFDISLDGERLYVSDLTQIAAMPASELEIVLTGSGANADLFLDQNGKPINTADVTISKMRAAGLAVNAEVDSGDDLFEEIGLSVRNAGTSAAKPVITLRFPSEYSSLEPVEFSASLRISFGGQEQEDSAIDLAGTFGRPEVAVNSDDVTVSAVSAVLFAREDIPSVLIDAGSGVLVEASMSAGGRYLIASSASMDPYDAALIAERNGVVDVIRLNATGFEPEQIKSVAIESGQILQVYDENGVLLGNTSQALPYSEKYYLADKTVRF